MRAPPCRPTTGDRPGRFGVRRHRDRVRHVPARLPAPARRLGDDVGLLTALPALTAFVLAIPFGRWLQGRRNIVPWYSRLRLIAWLSYAADGRRRGAPARRSGDPAMLAVWALASLPSTAGLVVFPIVMDGAAGPRPVRPARPALGDRGHLDRDRGRARRASS